MYWLPWPLLHGIKKTLTFFETGFPDRQYHQRKWKKGFSPDNLLIDYHNGFLQTKRPDPSDEIKSLIINLPRRKKLFSAWILSNHPIWNV